MTKKVVILGKGELAVRIAAWFRESARYSLEWVVPVVPEPTWTDSLIRWCVHHDVRYVSSGNYRDLLGAFTGDTPIDLAFSVFYDKIIDTSFMERCRRIVNLHNGPLPRYRGVSPINWALKNGETTHGVTIHEITPDVDAGPIVSQLVYDIDPDNDEVEDVYRRALRQGYRLFERTMPILGRIKPKPQDASRATYYSRRDDVRLGDRRGFRRNGSDRWPDQEHLQALAVGASQRAIVLSEITRGEAHGGSN